jgi:hypothetical protein
MLQGKGQAKAPPKLDLYKEHAAEYLAPKTPGLVQVCGAQYLVIAGQGPPGGDGFHEKLGALYSAAFTIKMAKKFAGLDYVVCKLEGLWWADNLDDDIFDVERETLNWKLLIRTPDFIGQADLHTTIASLRERGKTPLDEDVRLEVLEEGRCVQALHVGPYSAEPETLGRMNQFAAENCLTFHGLHHEIYLSDPRRVAASRLRTILRRPVRAKG